MLAGRTVRSLMGHTCFVPDPLPPADLQLSVSAQQLIEEATHALGKVDACRRLLPNPDLLQFASLKIEAIASSTIENTIASPQELMLFEITKRADREQVLEVSNYGKALEFGVASLKERPISLGLILELHQVLMQGVRGAVHGGKIKTTQNYIASSSQTTIENATYVPPAPEHTISLLQDLESYINGSKTEPRIVQVALTHYQFETIHPFADGNGRVGRLLIILQLIQTGLLTDPMLYPSAYFERSRKDYYAGLQNVRDSGVWENWITYFTRGLLHQAQQTMDLVESVQKLQDRLRREILEVRVHASLSRVLDAFLRYPVLTIAEVQRNTGLSFATASAAIERLASMKILEELTNRKRGRVYMCSELFATLFRDSA